MTDIRGLVQAALDAALCKDKVCSHWLRKVLVCGENPKEYVVYTLDRDSAPTYADGVPLVRAAAITVRYYYRADLLETPSGRKKIKAREDQILAALKSGGFQTPSGAFDAGDIDGVGFGTIVIECEYWRVV